MKSDNKIIGAGLITAISASLCCITPILTLFAGSIGLTSTFSWLEPFRPYFIGLTILVLGFAWYRKLKPVNQVDCACETKNAPNFTQSKGFLGIVTVTAGLMLTFPIYASLFYPKSQNQVILIKESNFESVEFVVGGMTCVACQEHIIHEVNKLPGIIKSVVSYEQGNAIIEFDNSKTTNEAIEKAIVATGYSVINKVAK